jgi:hypothetical protein
VRADARVGPVYAKLTVEERIHAIVTARLAERQPDLRILASMPNAQIPIYNRYAARLDRFDTMGRAWIALAAGRIDEIEGRLGWLTTLRLVDGRLEPLRDALAPPSPAPGQALRQTAQEVVDRLDRLLGGADGERPDGPHPSLAETLRDEIRIQIGRQWSEFRAIEQEADALVADLAGADPVAPELRALLEECQARLRALAGAPLLGEPVSLPEPDADLRRDAQAIVGDIEDVVV